MTEAPLPTLMTSRLEVASEPELYDLIVDYQRSKKFSAMGNKGMSQLFLLDNMLSNQLATDIGGSGTSQKMLKTGQTAGHATAHQEQLHSTSP